MITQETYEKMAEGIENNLRYDQETRIEVEGDDEKFYWSYEISFTTDGHVIDGVWRITLHYFEDADGNSVDCDLKSLEEEITNLIYYWSE